VKLRTDASDPDRRLGILTLGGEVVLLVAGAVFMSWSCLTILSSLERSSSSCSRKAFEFPEIWSAQVSESAVCCFRVASTCWAQVEICLTLSAVCSALAWRAANFPSKLCCILVI
jgi:hypothetical protein